MGWKKRSIWLVMSLSLSVSGCVLSSQWSENRALSVLGTEGNPPALNDGKRETIAAVAARNERVFTLKFSQIEPVRKIIIYNDNLFWFDLNYLDAETQEWKTFYSERHRRNMKGKRAQPEYVIDRLDFETEMIQIDISRTVDDLVIPKPMRAPGDQVVGRRKGVGGLYQPFFRVIKPARAKIREIEVYHLVKR